MTDFIREQLEPKRNSSGVACSCSLIVGLGGGVLQRDLGTFVVPGGGRNMRQRFNREESRRRAA